MGFERYTDWALDVPMYFVKRGDVYHDVAGASFRDLLAGNCRNCLASARRFRDWANHLSTLFPEVRLKRYLEMRGADAGTAPMLKALPALWVGLLYDGQALNEAEALVSGWTEEERQALRDGVPKSGCHAPSARHGRVISPEMLESPMKACDGAAGAMRGDMTKATSSSRSNLLLHLAARTRRRCFRSITNAGAVRSTRSSRRNGSEAVPPSCTDQRHPVGHRP